jgi:hypothetical protein
MIDETPGIDHLGIPKYGWRNEALHGVGGAGMCCVVYYYYYYLN